MRRFFCLLENIIGDKINISDKNQIHHLKDVLRLKIGDGVKVYDEKGNVYNSVIEELTSKNMALKIKAPKKTSATTKKIRITVACAIPKKSKFDDIIDKLTQLGVDRIIPMQTARVIIKFASVKKFKEVLLESRDYDLKLIPSLIGRRKTLKQVLSNTNPKNILVLIGPEGDFTSEEITWAKSAGFIPLTLGELVLRVETAAIAVMSILNYALDRN